jgi:hypothetical protein
MKYAAVCALCVACTGCMTLRSIVDPEWKNRELAAITIAADSVLIGPALASGVYYGCHKSIHEPWLAEDLGYSLGCLAYALFLLLDQAIAAEIKESRVMFSPRMPPGAEREDSYRFRRPDGR